MKLHYQTGTATFIQLAVVLFLIVLNNIITLVQRCVGNSINCVGDAFVSLVMIVFAGAWFGFLSVLGYAAQDKRSQRLATALIVAQVGTAFAALAMMRLPGSWYVAVSAAIVFVIAIWVIVLAIRLRQAKGRRIVHTGRRRLSGTKLSDDS